MISPLGYWPSDPNGYLRHLIVGAVLVLVLKRLNQPTTFMIIIFVALGKEAADVLWLNSFWSWMDIVFTISPLVFLKLEK